MLILRRALLLFAFVLTATLPLQAQFTLLPSGDFESWDGQGNYEEPSGSFWTTLNPLRAIGGPETVSKSTDAWSGTYSARMETKTYGTILVPGLLVSGTFDIQAAPNFLLPGTPYTSSPSRFMGHYKFFPVMGDSAAIGVVFTKYQNGQRDTLGEAGIIITDSVSNWTAFDIPVQWAVSNPVPDTIIVAMVSSADGQNFNGQVGSTLFVDDIGMDLTTNSIIVRPGPQGFGFYPNPVDRRLNFYNDQFGHFQRMELMDSNGRLLLEKQDLNSLDTDDLPGGLYFLRVYFEDRDVLTQKVLIRHGS